MCGSGVQPNAVAFRQLYVQQDRFANKSKFINFEMADDVCPRL
jgi:hypothetical protein